jgi:membrane-associated protein
MIRPPSPRSELFNLRRQGNLTPHPPQFAPHTGAAACAMEGINWAELFTAMDKFLIAIVDRNVLMVYLVLFLIFFSETGLVFMTFLPGDSLLFVAGAVAAQEAGLHIGILMAVIIIGAILGNTLNYYIGSWLGKKVYDGSLRWIDPVALRRTHEFYERHGGKTIVIARFVPIVRSFAPLVAGASGMDVRRFQLWNVLGAVLWVLSLVGGGYLFGQIPLIRDNLGVILIGGIAIVLGPLFLAALWRALRSWFMPVRPQPAPVRVEPQRPRE